MPIGAPIRAEGWVTAVAAADRRDRRADRRRRDGRRARDRRRRPTSPRDAGAQARAPGALRLPRLRRQRRAAPTPIRPTRWTGADDGHGHRRRRPRPAASRHRPRRRVRRRAQAGAEALGRALAELIDDPDAFAARPDRRASQRLADPEYLEGQHRVAPGHRAGLRRPLAAARRRRSAASATRPAARSPDARSSSSPTASSASASSSRAGSPSGSSSGRSPIEPERTWQLLRRAAREAGDWITVDVLAHPSARASPPSPTAGRSSSSSSTRRRAGSAGSSAPRSPRSRTSTAPRPRARGRRHAPCRSSAS